MVKKCDNHKIQQYSDQNKWKLFLYCKFIFSVHIFNAFGLTVRSLSLIAVWYKTLYAGSININSLFYSYWAWQIMQTKSPSGFFWRLMHSKCSHLPQTVHCTQLPPGFLQSTMSHTVSWADGFVAQSIILFVTYWRIIGATLCVNIDGTIPLVSAMAFWNN